MMLARAKGQNKPGLDVTTRRATPHLNNLHCESHHHSILVSPLYYRTTVDELTTKRTTSPSTKLVIGRFAHIRTAT
jgi:hypothetical protein